MVPALCDRLLLTKHPQTDECWCGPHGPAHSIGSSIVELPRTLPTVTIHADALGSIVATTDAAGTVTSRRQYDVWGDIEAGSTASGHSFTGREWDAETGLYYYRARYYDPKAGRFISEDPIGFDGGINFYAYTAGNPVRFTDPSGMELGTYPAGPGQTYYLYDNKTVSDAPLKYSLALEVGIAAIIAAPIVAEAEAVQAGWAALVAAAKDVKIDGPSKGFAHSQGRACQFRYKSKIIFRVDLHTRTPGGPPKWHVHILPPSGSEHGLTIPPQ